MLKKAETLKCTPGGRLQYSLIKPFPVHISKWDMGQNKISEFTPNKFLLRMFCFVLITLLCVHVSLHRLLVTSVLIFPKQIKYTLETC